VRHRRRMLGRKRATANGFMFAFDMMSSIACDVAPIYDNPRSISGICIHLYLFVGRKAASGDRIGYHQGPGATERRQSRQSGDALRETCWKSCGLCRSKRRHVVQRLKPFTVLLGTGTCNLAIHPYTAWSSPSDTFI
jgi:hypothetical protein